MTKPGNVLRFYAGLGLIGVMCLLTSLTLYVAGSWMKQAPGQAFARRTISWLFRSHLRIVQWLGVIQLDLDALDALCDAPAMVIAPNHPSMIDAALVLSRLPDLACVMKADILRSVLYGPGARLAGYIPNEPARQMLRASVDALQAGGHLLLFPEGTRTVHPPVNPIQQMVGVVARRADVPVQTVLIETNTAFLGKGWPLLRIPALPMVYKVQLGRRFEPPADVDAFTVELEAYFRHALAQAQLPALPVTTSSR